MVEQYHITLEKDIYLPGETIRGSIRIANRNPLKCRGIRVRVLGKGWSHIVTGSGDSREDHYHSQVYACCKKTVWGSVHKTPTLDECGENAIFGPPWAPDEGVLSIPMGLDQNVIVVRVMDYDWGKKDDLLGEVLLDVRGLLGRGMQEIPLTRNGKPEKGSVGVIVSMEEDSNVNYWGYSSMGSPSSSSSSPQRCVRVQIVHALGLRKADWFGKNDVYVQAYALPASTLVTQGSALPVPHENVILPAGDISIPFSFQLPNDLPSSFTGNDCYINYSVYSNIDVAWKMDPSARRFFSVVQPHAVATLMRPLHASTASTVYPQCCIPPFCCCSFPLVCFSPYGDLNFIVETTRSAYAPGEQMRVKIRLNSSWTDAAQHLSRFTVSLVQVHEKWANGHVRSFHVPVIAPTRVDVTIGADCFVDLIVPAVPPTYLGGLGNESGWLTTVKRYGGRWSTHKPDPVVWHYEIVMEATLSVPGFSVFNKTYRASTQVVIAAIGLSILPPFSDTAFWEAEESRAAVRLTPSTPAPAAAGGGHNYHALPPSVHVVAPVPWRSVPQVVAALPVLQARAVCTPMPGDAREYRDPEEDCNTRAQDLTYKPSYFVCQS